MTKTDFDLHKRKIFIQKISSETTEGSLEKYFEKYPIQWCAVPLDETGKIATSFLIDKKKRLRYSMS
jgi:RNA recognition motif-containing protein